MSIAVFCEECEKTFQVRDELAGRKGKCPRGHGIEVPLADASSEIVVPPPQDEFAFSGDARFSGPEEEDVVMAPKTKRRRPAHVSRDPEPEPTPTAAGDDFSFPTPSLIGGDAEEEKSGPKTGRHRKPEPKSVSKIHKGGNATGKPSMMPLYLGGAMFVLGLGGGIAMLIVSRGEAGPLRTQAEEANKKATIAEQKALQAEAATAAVKADLEAQLKKAPPKDPALKDAQTKLAAAEKRANEAERKLELQKGKEGGDATATAPAPKTPELDPTAPGGKDDPVMPRGKLAQPDPKMEPKKDPKKDMGGKPAADVPDGIPLGGKSWNVPSSIAFAGGDFKAGDLISLWPQEDAPVKAADGKLVIKYKWKLRKGKKLPESAVVGLVVQEANQFRMTATPVTISGVGGEGEAAFDAKLFKGKQQVFIFIGSDRAMPGGTAYSSMLGFQVDFGGAPKE